MIIAISDIRDELVYPVLKAANTTSTNILGEEIVTNKYLQDLEEYANDFVMSVAGVGLESIVTPAPYKLKELCKAKLCLFVCLAKSYSASLSTRGSDSRDSWSEKLEYYTTMVKTLEPQISKEMLLGDSRNTILFGSVQLLRG